MGLVAAVGARLLSAAFRVDPPDVRQGRLQPGGVVGRLARCRHAIVVGHHMMSSRRSWSACTPPAEEPGVHRRIVGTTKVPSHLSFSSRAGSEMNLRWSRSYR